MTTRVGLKEGKLNRRDILRLSALGASAALLSRRDDKMLRAARAADDVTLDFVWRTTQKEVDFFKDFFKNFEEQNPGTKVRQVYVPIEQYDQKVDLLVAANQPPAIWAPNYSRGVRYYASRERLVELDEFVSRDKYDFSDFYDGTLSLGKWKDKWVGIPALVIPMLLVYNKTLFEEAGVEPPPQDWNDKSWTWDALLEKAKALTKGKDQYGLVGVADQRYAIRNFGVDYFPQEVQETGYPTEFLGNTPEFTDALQFWGDLIHEHKVMPSASEANAMQAGLPNLFMTGKFGMNLMNAGEFEVFKDIEAFEWGTAPIPWPNNNLPRLNFMYLDHYASIAPQTHGDAAWNLLKQLTDPEGQKGYPIGTSGWIAPRKSLADFWVQQAVESSGQTEENVRVAVDGLPHMTPSPGHVTVEWGQYWDKAFKPSLDKFLLGQMDAKSAVAEMQPRFEQVRDETTPDAS